jgi:DNA-binding NtrC family response regulator
MQPMIVVVDRTALDRAVRMCAQLAQGDARAVVIVSSPRESGLRPGEALPPASAAAPEAWPVDLPHLLRSMETRYIEAALAATGGNRQAAADLLGLKRTTLVEKLRRGLATSANGPAHPAAVEDPCSGSPG